MRVLHVEKVTVVGGTQRHLFELLPALASRGIEVRMVAAAAGPDAGTVIGALRARGVDTVAVPAGPHVNPFLVGRLIREVRRFQPDIVHTHLVHADLHGQAAARVVGVPGVASIHNAMPFYRRQPTRSVTRFAGRLARRTIAISEHVRRMIEGIGLARPGTVRVVPYGIDPSHWMMSTRERRSAREELGILPHDVVAGVASRLIPDKGHDVLLESFTEARTRAPTLRLLVAGEGPLRRPLEAAAAGDPAIRFVGHIDDVRAFMNACDALVMPTLPDLSEGFGLAALEAMAAGRPVIATTVGSLPEVVVDNVTGHLVAPGSAAALADALVAMATDKRLRSRLGRAGRERALTEFSIERMVARTIEVYREAV